MTRSAATHATPALDPEALRIVLFGMPDAGKSSLLGALAQAAQTQERQLQGRLFDTSSGLAELQQRVYDEKPRETLQEIVPYPVRYEPLRGNRPDPGGRLDAVLVDCDGRKANELLTHPKALSDRRAGQLADAIRGADALVLVVDASNTDEQIDGDLGEFVRFLRLLERQRAGGSEVGGLPVFLVLSKCDLLMKPGESAAAWKARIAERRAHVERRFRHFLERQPGGPVGFGWVDLSLAATAVRNPTFHGAAAREPFGVADLFRDTFRAARDYRRRTLGARRWLLTVAAGALALLAVLLGGAVALVLTRETFQPVALAGSVEGYRSREGATPSTRLTEPLQRKISELTDIQQHADFPKLSEEQRAYVERRLRELVAYQEFKTRLERERPPAELRTPEELGRLELRLRESLGPPPDYAAEWSQTDAELLRQKWLDDIAAIRRAVADEAERLGRHAAEATDLLRFRAQPGGALPWVEWHDRVRELLARAGRQPHPEGEPLRGSRSLPAVRAPAVTYAAVHGFRTVEEARRDRERARGRLERVRDVSTALGLAGDGAPDQAPLRVPEDFTADQARTRVAALEQKYPNHGDWSFQDLPDAARPGVELAARKSYERLIEAGRAVVHAELARLAPDGRETRERWLAVARWLPEASALRDWGRLVKVLRRLTGEAGGDPAAELAEYLQRPTIGLSFKTVRLALPDDVHTSRLRPAGDLVVTQNLPGGPTRVRFRRLDESVRDNRNRLTTYTFAVEGERAALTFTPGDEFFAELALRDEADKEWRLTWLQCRSEMYRYECLLLLPRFNPAGTANPLEGPRKELRLGYTPEAGVPRVPDLMPYVNLKR